MRLALLLIAALAACGGQARPLAMPSNAAAAAGTEGRAERTGPAIVPALYRDLALVKSFEGMHQTVSRRGLDAAARVFEHVRWKGMTRDSVAALLGEPTSREPVEESWRYDLDHKLSSVFLKLRFANGVVDRVVYGDAEIRFGSSILE
jgi:hypothetical protein